MKLTSQEKMVLWGLTRYPEKSIRELSEILNINYWSVYKILEKFKKGGMIKEIIIPNYRALGFELLLAGYGSLTPERIKEITGLERMLQKESGISKSGIFLAFAESYRGFVIGVAKNYTQIVKNMLYVDRIVGIRELITRERPKIVLLPLEITRIPIFFDYSRLIAKELGFPYHRRDEKIEPKGTLRNEEIRVMVELAKNPGYKIKDVARKLHMSRAKVANVKKKLFREGWCERRIIPDMKLFGYEVLVFAHWESNPEKIEMIEKNASNINIGLSPIVFLAYNPLEGILLALFKSLRESREIVSIFSKFAEKEKVLIKEPELLFLSLEEGMEFRSHEHSSILHSLL